MEVDSYPRFLRAKSFGNLVRGPEGYRNNVSNAKSVQTPVSALVRLAMGLFALWAALATAFSLIFLDKSRTLRLWVRDSLLNLRHRRSCSAQVILPFGVAVLLILEHFYDLDPLLVFFGVSETVRCLHNPIKIHLADLVWQTPFRMIRIREPYVKRLLVGRAIWVTVLTIVATACLTVIFALVPGHRL